MLGFVLVFQVCTGLLLVFFYSPRVLLAFDSIDYLSRSVWFGFFPRVVHLVGASLFSLFLYFHVGKNLFVGSYFLIGPWWRGSSILLLEMAIAFFGYVLPWGQISLWGATVITNLISAIPVFGTTIVYWVWGGFNLNNATLSFFFVLHFFVPFVVLVLVIVHLIFLHETSSTSSIQVFESFTKVKFSPYYVTKDVLNLVVLFVLYGVSFFSPWVLGDPENWIPANPMVSPVHIQPEWYFLFAYEILRSIPNKLGGVVALALSVLCLYLISLFPSFVPKNSYLVGFWLGVFFHSFLFLTWLGRCPVIEPFIFLGSIYSFLYFFSLFCLVFLS